MNCENIKHLMIEYMYNEISVEDDLVLQKHLENCKSCRNELKSLKGTSSVLQKWADSEPGALLSFIPEAKPNNWSRLFNFRLPRFVVGFAAAVVIVLIALSIFNTRISIQDSGVDVQFSLLKSTRVLPESERFITREDFLRYQEQNAQMVAQLLEISNRQQEQETLAMLEQFYREINHQRLEDMKMVSRNLEYLQYGAERKFTQTDMIISDLIRYASSQPR